MDDGQLIWHLFLLSVIALTLAKLTGTAARAPGSGLLWNAVQELRITRDPFWLIAAHGFLRTVPAGIGLGWLYACRGIESAMLGVFVARVVEHLLFVFVLVRFD